MGALRVIDGDNSRVDAPVGMLPWQRGQATHKKVATSL